MSFVSRRKMLTGLALTGGAAAGVAGAAALAKANGLLPPDHGGVFGPGASLTYAAHRLLTRNAMAREFDASLISRDPFANPTPFVADEKLKKMQAAGFADWQLQIDGLVSRPGSIPLADLRRQPSRSQVTQLACEEGWSYIAQWTGVPLADVLEQAGIQPQAKYVVYFSMESGWWDSLDMADALHSQTLLAHSMNGAPMPAPFGGPLRMRVPRQLGYKSVKFINRLTVTDDIRKFGKGLGSPGPEYSYSWYAGI